MTEPFKHDNPILDEIISLAWECGLTYESMLVFRNSVVFHKGLYPMTLEYIKSKIGFDSEEKDNVVYIYNTEMKKWFEVIFDEAIIPQGSMSFTVFERNADEIDARYSMKKVCSK